MPTLLCAITLEQYTRQVGMEWYGRTNGSYLLLPPLSKTVERDDIRLKSDITIRPESKRKDQTIYSSTADEDDHFKR
jgi:ABC-type transporter lipoprotein component MlaA